MCHVQFKQLKFKTTLLPSSSSISMFGHCVTHLKRSKWGSNLNNFIRRILWHKKQTIQLRKSQVMPSFQASLKSHVHCLIKSNSLLSVNFRINIEHSLINIKQLFVMRSKNCFWAERSRKLSWSRLDCLFLIIFNYYEEGNEKTLLEKFHSLSFLLSKCSKQEKVLLREVLI